MAFSFSALLQATLHLETFLVQASSHSCKLCCVIQMPDVKAHHTHQKICCQGLMTSHLSDRKEIWTHLGVSSCKANLALRWREQLCVCACTSVYTTDISQICVITDTISDIWTLRNENMSWTWDALKMSMLETAIINVSVDPGLIIEGNFNPWGECFCSQRSEQRRFFCTIVCQVSQGVSE